MIAADNPVDAEAVAMIRALLDAFIADPTRFTDWECGFIARMWRLTRSYTDGTPMFDGLRREVLQELQAKVPQ